MQVVTNPYACRYPLWLKGNLHTHTTLSDGALSPEQTLQMFAQRGYDFVALTDHDIVAQPSEHPRIIWLPGVEHSAQQHILRIGVTSTLPRDYSYQSVIDLTIRAGGVVILNHPNWGTNRDHWSNAQLLYLQRYHGIEIYNNVIEYMEGNPYATDRWDLLLTAGRQVWGYANEDTHYLQQVGSAYNVVNVRVASRDEILEALKVGRFYASTGVVVEEIALEGIYLRVRTTNAKQLCLISVGGEVVECQDGTQAVFSLAKARRYARVEALGEGRARAWSQPIWLSDD